MIPSPPAPENVPLALALAGATSESQQRRPVFEALLRGSVLVPTTTSSPEEPRTVAVMAGADGRRFLVAFSDVGALRTWSRDLRAFVAMTGMDLAAVARRHRVDSVLLNPGQESVMSLATGELDLLADGLLPQGNGAATVGEDSPPWRLRASRWQWPNALLTALRELRQRPGIEAIYLLDAQHGEGEPTPTIAVRPNVAGTTAETSLGEVARLVAATAPSGQRIDVVMADDALDGEAARLGAGLP